MNCEKCVRFVSRTLGELPGVTRASATLEGRRATVEHEPGGSQDSVLIGALERHGYDARITAD